MAKVLILNGTISDYRVSTLNHIAQKHKLVIVYFLKDDTVANCEFEKIKLDYRKVGPFYIIKGLDRLCKGFDVVIFPPDAHQISYCLLPFKPTRFKTISWGIGFRCSYEHPYLPYRKHGIVDFVNHCILSASDANLFYMPTAREFWKNTSLNLNKTFIATNTTVIEEMEFRPELKKDFLFVGTLYKKKGVDLLLQAFNEAVSSVETDIKLHIVGKGDERAALENYVMEHHLQDKVIFHGPIYDEKALSKLFQQSLLCFSPTQAGLSVPKSMGYGVPFVTRKDAITGGEIYHITPNENGIVYERNEELLPIMREAMSNPAKFVDMGRKAKDYYNQHATVAHMAKGVLDAIDYVLKDSNKD